MSMANKIQKHWIALSKTKMLLRYLEKGNRIYDYKNMEAFYIRAKIIRQLTLHKDMLKEFNDNLKYLEIEKERVGISK